MKLRSSLAAALLISASAPAFAHPEGHDYGDQPSVVECEQLKKMSKEEADKPAMKELKQRCAQAAVEKGKQSK
jgi:hypothetical protein